MLHFFRIENELVFIGAVNLYNLTPLGITVQMDDK